jgi:hypothetical protein
MIFSNYEKNKSLEHLKNENKYLMDEINKNISHNSTLGDDEYSDSFLECLKDLGSEFDKFAEDQDQFKDITKIITPVYGINFSEVSIERILFPPQIFIDPSFPSDLIGVVFEYYTGINPFIELIGAERLNNLEINNDYYIHDNLISYS